MIPYRGHAGLITSPATYAAENALTGALGIERGPYLVQTPHSGLVIGPYNATVLSEFGTPKDLFYIEDDSVVVPKFRDCECASARIHTNLPQGSRRTARTTLKAGARRSPARA